MRPPGKQRLAQRHEVETTQIHWKVARRGRRRLTLVEAAVVEVSVMGAAIVAPDKFQVAVGNRVEIFWENLTALVLVRRVTSPYRGSKEFVLYGVEYLDGRSELGPALYERMVVEPAARAAEAATIAAAEAEAAAIEARKMVGPSVWAEPIAWAPESSDA